MPPAAKYRALRIVSPSLVRNRRSTSHLQSMAPRDAPAILAGTFCVAIWLDIIIAIAKLSHLLRRRLIIRLGYPAFPSREIAVFRTVYRERAAEDLHIVVLSRAPRRCDTSGQSFVRRADAFLGQRKNFGQIS